MKWTFDCAYRQFSFRCSSRAGQQDLLYWSRAYLDGVSGRVKRGVADRPERTGRGKPGSKYRILVEPLVDATPAVKGRGRPAFVGPQALKRSIVSGWLFDRQLMPQG